MLISSQRVHCYSTSFTDTFTVVEKQLKTDHSLTNIVENIKAAGEGKLQSFSSVVDGKITAAIDDHKEGKEALAVHLFNGLYVLNSGLAKAVEILTKLNNKRKTC